MNKKTEKPEPTLRRRAVDILLTWERSGVFPDRLIGDRIQGHRFIMEVVYGVLRQHRSLQWMIQQMTDRTPPPPLRWLLETGLYQLFCMDHAEPYAVVHDSVEIAKAQGSAADASRFVNAVLRRAQREETRLRRELSEQPEPVRLSHPDLLHTRWTEHFGSDQTTALCKWNNRASDTILRIHRMQTTPEDFQATLDQAGIAVTPHPYRPEDFFILPRGIAVRETPGYHEAHFTVQDPATQAAVDLLDPQPGEAVLDVCAAPGGKTVMIAERMDGQGHLVAIDMHPGRVERLAENLVRLKHDWITMECADATCWTGGPFDAILLDAPCTNTGVIRRRPDARWRFSTTSLEEVTALQRKLLDHVSCLLAPRGRIVYSTCSLEPEENQRQAAAWLENHPSFSRSGEKTLFPPLDGVDGVYVVRLEKTRSSARKGLPRRLLAGAASLASARKRRGKPASDAARPTNT